MWHSLIGLILMSLALFACRTDTPDEDVITLEFWTIALGDAFADYINGMVDTYENSHPGIRVEWVDVSGTEVSEKFLAALVGDTPPDLANVYDLPRFLEHGVLANMDELVAPAQKKMRLENFWHGMGYYQGSNYAIPWYSSVNMLWYNREIFVSAGLDPDDPPTSVDEMLEMGRIIRRATGKYGVSWYLHPSLGTPAWALLRLDGFWPLFDGDQALITAPQANTILQKWIDAYRDGVFPPEALAAAGRDNVNWFIEGRAAMLPFSGGWITRYFDASFETKVGAAPQPRGALGRVPATNQVLVVPAKSPHLRHAVEFGLFVTNDENQLEFCRRVAILPSTVKAAGDPYFRRSPETIADRANNISAADIPYSFVQAPPDVPRWSRMEDILHEEFARAMGGRQNLKTALERVESKWNHLLQYR